MSLMTWCMFGEARTAWHLTAGAGKRCPPLPRYDSMVHSNGGVLVAWAEGFVVAERSGTDATLTVWRHKLHGCRLAWLALCVFGDLL